MPYTPHASDLPLLSLLLLLNHCFSIANTLLSSPVPVARNNRGHCLRHPAHIAFDPFLML